MPTILFVDDVPLFRELGALFLARCGRVITASCGREALAVAAREQPAVIVLDSHLPDLSGEEVCRRLKQPGAGLETPIVVVTGSGAADEHAAAIRAGADDVLAKPLSRMALVETVQRFTRFSEPRGLPRVSVETPVHIRASDAEAWGTSRNLSRGGMFLECLSDVGGDELDLEFHLPGTGDPLCPTARVIWRRPEAGAAAGLGVRFLELDAPAARRLDAYVHEWALPGGWTRRASPGRPRDDELDLRPGARSS